MSEVVTCLIITGFHSLKSEKSLQTSVDLIQRSDGKVFAGVIADFTALQKIQLTSDICTLQQLERKDRLVQIPESKKADME